MWSRRPVRRSIADRQELTIFHRLSYMWCTITRNGFRPFLRHRSSRRRWIVTERMPRRRDGPCSVCLIAQVSTTCTHFVIFMLIPIQIDISLHGECIVPCRHGTQRNCLTKQFCECYTHSGTLESPLQEWVNPFSLPIDDITVASAWIFHGSHRHMIIVIYTQVQNR